ncbi:monooxygenase [Lepidopterella palustris CBS 459.81]|uniref:Monooxygenase n=1 Tax=Lepidopterella palustris CBS 459.81 TaxID=1314670 RepID=A0A8E2E2U4_9PEZI|nr:monooxygenase [Lepidopterella palustris CBS 459.81]
MPSFTQPDEHRFCIIIGAGITGILQGSEFVRKKIIPLEEVAIIEKNDNYGGVWFTNVYPRCACDIPSHVYSVSWAPNPYWGRKFAPQHEIQKYYEDIAKDHGLPAITNFSTRVIRADWDDNQLLWVLQTENVSTGVKKVWTCNILLSASGQFSVPKKAPVSGLDAFKGEEWHTGSWPKDATVKGKRVAVVGTGPSAAQLLPGIYQDVRSLVVYQRSPSFCLPRDDFPFSKFKQWVFAHVPFVMKVYKWYLYEMAAFLGRHVFVPGTWWQKKAIQLAWAHLDKQVKDPVVREKLRPHDNFGCKRPLLLDDYYPIFNSPNVELVTDPVVALTEHGIVSQNKKTDAKKEHEIDVLIWGTGYRPSEFGVAFPCRGRSGILLSEKYVPENYSLYGVAIDDFPNFFNYLGPNSLAFEASVVDELEKQSAFIAQFVAYLYNKNRGSYRFAVMASEERVKSWTLSLRDGQSKHPANTPSCESYYKNAYGVVYFWPFMISKYYKLITKPNFKRDWVLLTARPGQPTRITEVS